MDCSKIPMPRSGPASESAATAIPAPFRSIASVLIRRIVALALLCMLLLGGLQAVFEYQRGQKEFARAVHVIAENGVSLLSTALWDIETSAVQRQVQSLVSLPEVGHVRLRAATGPVFEAGKVGYGDIPPSVVLQIPSPRHSGGNSLGTLEIWANASYFHKQIWTQTAAVVGGYLLITLLLCLTAAGVLRRDLQKPLQQIARFATELKPHNLSLPLTYVRPTRAHQDEIDLLVQGIARLQEALRGHIQNLDQLVLERTQQLEELVTEVQELSRTDTLTGCLNRRAMDERLPIELQRSLRYGRDLSVMFADLDYFKRINDGFGHATGDVVLRELAQRYLANLRTPIDWVARYGGEEFIIVLPDCGLEDAVQLAQRLRVLTQSAPVQVAGRELHLTASFGVAQFDQGESAAQLLARADAALYRAKAAGRDRVCQDDFAGTGNTVPAGLLTGAE